MGELAEGRGPLAHRRRLIASDRMARNRLAHYTYSPSKEETEQKCSRAWSAMSVIFDAARANSRQRQIFSASLAFP
jgi:hypothetical protein